MTDFIKAVEAKINEKIPQLNPGDTVSVHVKIKEGDRERIQEFKGIVIRLRKGGNDSPLSPFAAWLPMVSVWSALSCFALRASTRLWSNATAKSAAHSCTSCATAPARARASSRNSTKFKIFTNRVLRKTLKVFKTFRVFLFWSSHAQTSDRHYHSQRQGCGWTSAHCASTFVYSTRSCRQADFPF